MTALFDGKLGSLAKEISEELYTEMDFSDLEESMKEGNDASYDTIFKKLMKLKPGKGGEIHITDAIQSLINNNEKFIGHNFSGKYLDCGTMKGYIKSNIEVSKI